MIPALLTGIWTLVTEGYPKRLTLKNVETGSCYNEDRSPESQTEFGSLELKNVCQADRPLPPGMRGKFSEVSKGYEKEYYYPVSTKPGRSTDNQGAMKRRNRGQYQHASNQGTSYSQTKMFTSGDHVNDSSFHEVSLNSTATDLDTSFHEELGQVPFLNTSAASHAGSFESSRPAATSSPTPDDNAKFERQPSQGVDKIQLSDVAQQGNSQEFFQSFGLSFSSSSVLPSGFSKQHAAMLTRNQQSTGSEFFDQYFSQQPVQQTQNSSVQLFTPPNAQPQPTINSRNPAIRPELPSSKTSQQSVPLQRTSQLFASEKHNDMFDRLTALERKTNQVFKQPAAETFTRVNQRGVVPDFPTSPNVPSGCEEEPVISVNKPVDIPTMQSQPLPKAQAGASKGPSVNGETSLCSFESGSAQLFPAVPHPDVPQPDVPPALPSQPLQNTQTNSFNLHSGYEGTSHPSAQPESSQQFTPTPQSVNLSSPSTQSSRDFSTNMLFDGEAATHSSFKSGSAQSFPTVSQVSHPVEDSDFPSASVQNSQVTSASPCSENKEETLQPFNVVSQLMNPSISSPPQQHSQVIPSNLPFGNKEATLQSIQSKSTQPFNGISQLMNSPAVTSPPMQHLLVTPSSTYFGDKATLQFTQSQPAQSFNPVQQPPLSVLKSSPPMDNPQVTGTDVPITSEEETPQTFKSGQDQPFPAESQPVRNLAFPPGPNAHVTLPNVSSWGESATARLFNPDSAQPFTPTQQITVSAVKSSLPMHTSQVTNTDVPSAYKEETRQTSKSGQALALPPVPGEQVALSNIYSQGEAGTKQLFSPGTAQQVTAGSQPADVSLFPPVPSHSAEQNSSNIPSEGPGTTSGMFHAQQLHPPLGATQPVKETVSQHPLIKNPLVNSSNFSSQHQGQVPVSFESGSAHEQASTSQAIKTAPFQGDQNTQFESAQKLFEAKPTILGLSNVSHQAAPVQHDANAPQHQAHSTPTTVLSDIKMSSKKFDLGLATAGPSTGHNQATAMPPAHVAHTTQEHAPDVEDASSDSGLPRVGSNHSAFHSVPPSPKHSSTSLTEENMYKSRESPLRSDVQKEKKNMYPASNTVLSSLWENGSQLSMPGLILSAPCGQKPQTEHVNPILTQNSSMPVIQSYSAPPSSKPSALHRTTGVVPSSSDQPLVPSDVSRADASSSVPQHAQYVAHSSAGHPQLIHPGYPGGIIAVAHQNEAPFEPALSQPTVSSDVQHHGMSSNQSITESRTVALNTSTNHQIQPVLPASRQADLQTVPSEVTMGNYQRPGPQVNVPPSSKEGSLHYTHGYHQHAATPGHSNEHQRFHPDVNHSEAQKAGMLRSEQQQVAGTRSEMAGSGYGGYSDATSGVQTARGEVTGRQISSVAAQQQQQQRQPGVEQQGTTGHYHAPAGYEDYDSEEECNRYYHESGKWFWSFKRLCWIHVNSAPRKSTRSDYDPGYDDSNSEYSRSESSRGRYRGDERERGQRHHSRRRGQRSHKHSRSQDFDYRDYNDYLDYYRDYYREYYRKRSESSGSSGSRHRGTPSGHSSGAQTPRSCSSRSSSRGDRSHRSKHRRSYDYEDGYRQYQDYSKGPTRQSSRSSRRRSDSSSYSTSGESNSLSDSIKGTGYYRQQGIEKMADYQLERVPTPERLTPKQHTVPHIVCKFGTASRVCWVPSKHVVDGEKPDVVLAEVKDTAACQTMVSFPGPLRRGQTHKRDVVRFAKDMALAAYKNLSGTFEQREASYIFWKVLAVMVQQNGVYLNSDIAEVLTAELPDISSGNLEQEESNTTSKPRQVTFHQNQNVEYDEDLLSTYRELLLCGKTSDALQFAISTNMWGHALTLSCQLDTKIFSSVMNRFIGNLGENDSLLCLYQHLSQKRPSFLDKKSGSWRNHLAIMIANPSRSPDKDRRNIFALGENLESRGIFEAAHLCYLLAGEPVTSENGMILLGTDLGKTRPQFVTPEAIQRTEIYEYAMTLKDETFSIADFQAWKVCYANMLAESGLNNKAYRYCEIIVENVLKNPAMFTKVMIGQIHSLAIRLHELVFLTPGLDWIEKLKQLCEVENRIFNAENRESNNEVPQQQLPLGNADQAMVPQGDRIQGQTSSDQEGIIGNSGMANVSKENQPAPVPSIPTMFVPNMTNLEPQSFQSDLYQTIPTSGTQADVMGQDVHNVSFAPEFVPQEPVQNRENYPYSGITNNQAMPSGMVSEETSLPSRQPSEMHFYGAEAADNGANQLYEGDSFEHLMTAPRQSEPNYFQPEKSGENGQLTSEDNFDYYSMSKYQKPVDNMATSVKNEAAPTPKAKEPEKKTDDKKEKEKQAGGWSIGGFLKSFIPKGKNEMILPDDSNKPIYWDEKLGKWVNTEESEEEKADLPPPPIDPSLVGSGGPSISAVPTGTHTHPSPPSGVLDRNQLSQTQLPSAPAPANSSQVLAQPAPPPSAPPPSAPGCFVPEQPELSLVNAPLTTPSRFSRRALGSKGRKSNYVDVLSSSGSTTKPSMDAAPLLFQPLGAQSSFVGGSTPSANETQPGTNSEVRLPPSSQSNANSNLDGPSDFTDSPTPAVPFFNPADYSGTPTSSSGRGTRLYPKIK